MPFCEHYITVEDVMCLVVECVHMWQHLYDRIISVRGQAWAYKTNLTQPPFTGMPVPNRERQWSCICVVCASIVPVVLRHFCSMYRCLSKQNMFILSTMKCNDEYNEIPLGWGNKIGTQSIRMTCLLIKPRGIYLRLQLSFLGWRSMKMQLFSINHNIKYYYKKSKRNSYLHKICRHHQ